MNKKVLVAVADGTEELEAVTIIDILRRARLDVIVASVMSAREVICSRGVRITADRLIDECVNEGWDAVICPGGMPGAAHLSDTIALVEILQSQNDAERCIGAICAAPQVVLSAHGLLNGRKATAYPGFREKLDADGAVSCDDAVVNDGHFITSQGPGTAMIFDLALVNELAGEEVAHEVADGLLV